MQDKTVSLLSFWAPRYWPVWLGLLAMRIGAALPFTWQQRIGARIGLLAMRLIKRRRRIAKSNIAACFPHYDDAQREALLRAHFRSIGMGLMEIAYGWWGSVDDFERLGTIHGLEHMNRALEQGRGVVLLAGHFTTIEIGGILLAQHIPMNAMYRRFENPLFEEVMRRKRLKHVSHVIQRGDFRGMLRRLRKNNAVLYMPDQAYVRSNSVSVPFFDIPAPTSTGTSRLVARSGALVVPFLPVRRSDGSGYELFVYPPLENFPTDDATADAARLNALFEEQARRAPEQYLWVHRRFKGVDGIYE
ncbi:MAG: LpxL/LpxP family Kdo(2)-lipid IV(A) lauroyl/palmitoleoyl acyltransferase [Gammaproteobacteria bacterium]